MNGGARIGLVVALLAGLAGLGQATAGTGPQALRPQQAAVVGASVVCPDAADTIAAGAVGSGPGSLTTRRLDGPPSTQPITSAGAVVVGTGRGGPLVLAARGAVAAGLAVEQLTGTPDGLTGLRCGSPSTSTWFVGGATTVGNATELVLVNADDRSALVEVTVWSATGPADRRPGRGIVVPASSHLRLPMDSLAPDRGLLALHVQASRGRVAAALVHVRLDGRTPLGTDWVPPTGPPAREVVVPGLPAGSGRRVVVVTNPGPDDAVVSIELATGDGRLVPPGLAAVPVPAGTSVGRDVSAQLAQTPAAVRVVSDGPPVLAAGFVDDVLAAPVRELAWAGAVGPLGTPALLPAVSLSPRTEVTLLLTAFGPDAVVEVVPVPVLGGTDPLPAIKRVEVPAGTTAALRLTSLLPAGATARLAFQVRPVTGVVHAARHVRELGLGTTILPVRAAAPTVPRPAVSADPLVGSGR